MKHQKGVSVFKDANRGGCQHMEDVLHTTHEDISSQKPPSLLSMMGMEAKMHPFLRDAIFGGPWKLTNNSKAKMQRL